MRICFVFFDGLLGDYALIALCGWPLVLAYIIEMYCGKKFQPVIWD